MQNQFTIPSASSGLDETVLAYLRGGADRKECLAHHPDLAGELAQFFADEDYVQQLTAPLREVTETSSPDAAATLASPPESGAQETAPAPSLRGRSFGDYEVLAEIGQGGMGIVYKAMQLRPSAPSRSR